MVILAQTEIKPFHGLVQTVTFLLAFLLIFLF